MSEKKKWSDHPAVLTVISSLICVLLGVVIAYGVLLLINPAGAGKAIQTILLNFMMRPTAVARIKAFGNTLTKTAPLLMCALSVQFCYKVGLFNIGAAGQYCLGACVGLYAALAWHLPWFICSLLAALAGGVLGMISGVLKAYRNVNEVISGIMLNWITIYFVNIILSEPEVKDPSSPFTYELMLKAKNSIIPTGGLEALFPNNKGLVTIAIPISILVAVIIWVIQNKTRFGYELRATGYNKSAAKYAGMKENKNIILTLAIGGALAGLGAAFLFLTGYSKWSTTQTSVPSMGFNGIAATFLGGLHPIGTIFSSFFIQQITDGGSLIDKTIYPSQISDLMSGIIIYLCGFVMFFKYAVQSGLFRKKNLPVKEERKEG